MDDAANSLLDSTTIEACFGFPAPRALIRLLQCFAVEPSAHAFGVDSRFHRATGLIIQPPRTRPVNCPSELHLIGETGMDGVVCGCVLHDPKLSGEVPLALFDPTVGRGDYLGLDTRRSIGVLIGMQLGQLDGEPLANACMLAEEMGFDPAELPSEPPLEARPRIPPGWRFANTADGLGVVAQDRHFAPEQEFDEDADAFTGVNPTVALAQASDAIEAGHPATALWYVRNAIVLSDDFSRVDALRDMSHRAYRAMGRVFQRPR